eukprot:TRINITY_DN9790_c0_g1_i1.p1 TRINITY_DN9790_c0_g1~~TRINITY_DN9790_c0_g1_i1.p1  ORF type:complete len:202 (-),score=28.95 TRINITY_DN9790_c0_g1_i1:131-736(-)
MSSITEEATKAKQVVENYMKDNKIEGTVLFATICGDIEYNLLLPNEQFTPEYYGIYATKTTLKLSLVPPGDVFSGTTSCGHSIQIYEIQKWCEMVISNRIRAIEDIYAYPSHCYCSSDWLSIFPEHKRKLLSRLAALRFYGFALSNILVNKKKKMKMLMMKKQKAEPSNKEAEPTDINKQNEICFTYQAYRLLLVVWLCKY